MKVRFAKLQSFARKGQSALPLVTLLLALVGCSVLKPKTVEKIVVVTETRDSIIIRDRIVHDTAHVEIPVIVERNVTRDDSSHLENQFAISDARIKDGILYHALMTRPQTMDVPVELHVTDTTSVHEKDSTKEDVHTEIQYVEKELTRWQSFRINAFWWLFISLVLSLVWIFRKPITAVLKLCLKL